MPATALSPEALRTGRPQEGLSQCLQHMRANLHSRPPSNRALLLSRDNLRPYWGRSQRSDGSPPLAWSTSRVANALRLMPIRGSPWALFRGRSSRQHCLYRLLPGGQYAGRQLQAARKAAGPWFSGYAGTVSRHSSRIRRTCTQRKAKW